MSRLLKIIGLFCRISSLYRALLQKRPIILRSLLIEATPYSNFSYPHVYIESLSISTSTCPYRIPLYFHMSVSMSNPAIYRYVYVYMSMSNPARYRYITSICLCRIPLYIYTSTSICLCRIPFYIYKQRLLDYFISICLYRIPLYIYVSLHNTLIHTHNIYI